MSTCRFCCLLPRDRASRARGNALRDLVIRHIVSHDSSGANQSTLSDAYTRENDRSASDRRAALHSRGHNLPVGFGLQPAALRCPRVQVVDEHDSVADEDIIFDGDPFANKSVGRDLAPVAYKSVLLNLDEGSNLSFIAHRAAIEIDQIRLEDLHSVAQNNVGRNWHEDRFIRVLPWNGSTGRAPVLPRLKMEQIARYNRIVLASTPAQMLLAAHQSPYLAAAFGEIGLRALE